MSVPGASPLAGGLGLGAQVDGLTEEERLRRRKQQLAQQNQDAGDSPGSALASGYSAAFGGLGY
jgi:hypothetical protein